MAGYIYFPYIGGEDLIKSKGGGVEIPKSRGRGNENTLEIQG